MEERFTPAPVSPMESAGGASGVEGIQAQAAGAMEEAREQGGRMLTQAKEQLRSRVTDQQQQAAGSLDSVASALRQSVDTLRTDQHAGLAGMFEGAAGAVENVSAYLREHDIQDMSRQVEEFGRRQPALFLGAAFALGFAAARFLKSGAPSPGGYTSRDGQYHWSGVYGEREYEERFGKSYYSGAPTTDVTHEGTGRYGGGPAAAEAGHRTDVAYDVDEAADEQSSRSTLS